MKNSTAQMHKIILSLAGVMSAFAITIPISMVRVSSTEKFAGQPFNSQTCETYKPAEREVVSWPGKCSKMTVAPLPKDKSSAAPTPAPAGIPSGSISPQTAAPAQTPAEVVITPAHTIERFMKSVYTVAYSPDSDILAASTEPH